LQTVTESSPYVEEARAAVGEVRAVEPPEGTNFLVGGLPAGQKDFISNLYGNVPYAVVFVLGVTYIVLFLTFRSFFIPLKAVIVNILSLTASFGAMVFVFQDGNLSGLLGFTPLGFIDATLPILMFCTIFGVSMDYEVFLLSRIREAYEHGDSNTASVAKGLVATAGIITSAAAIIVVVTGAFAFTGIITTKAIGLGLAVAVLVDATIIRVLLVPATMRLLGDWNWWPGGRKKSVFRDNGKRGIGNGKLLAGTVLLYLARRVESANGESPHLLRALAELVEPDGKDQASEHTRALRATEEVLKPLASALLLDYLAKERRTGVESMSKMRGIDGPPRGDRRSLGNRVSQTGEQGGKDAQEDVIRRGERQDVDGNGHSREDYDQQKGRHEAEPGLQKSLRPRPGKAHLDSLHRLGRDLHHAAGYSDGEQPGPGTAEDGGAHYRERASREECREY
jgi:MMPL family